MSDEITAICARWAGVRWHYGQNSLSPTYIGDAWIYQDPATVDQESQLLIDLDEPNEAEITFLQLAAAAPADIAALLVELTAARALMQALLSQPGVTRTPEIDRLMDAYNEAVRRGAL